MSYSILDQGDTLEAHLGADVAEFLAMCRQDEALTWDEYLEIKERAEAVRKSDMREKTA